MVALPIVEIPGYREAVKKERTLRDAAFLDGHEMLCGEIVVPLSLRRLIWLEQAHNGFICPWKWDSDEQLIAHALALIYFCRPNFQPPNTAKWSFWKAYGHALSQHRFSVRVLRRVGPEKLVEEVTSWLNDAFMDAPVGSADSVGNQSYASYPAYVFDKFGEAGLTYTPEQIMDMPIKRLWQHFRVAAARINDAKLTNPSDEIAVAHIETLNRK